MNAGERCGPLKRKILDAVEEVRGNTGTKFRCLASIDADKKCCYEQQKFNTANFKRHLISTHPEVAQRLELLNEVADREENTYVKRPKTRITIETTRTQVLQGTLRLVTDNYLPIRFPDWKGIKLLLDPLWSACHLTITRNTIPTLVHRAATVMRGIISDKLRQILVCLKIDAATRHSRSVFGINATYADNNGAIQILHLGKLIHIPISI